MRRWGDLPSLNRIAGTADNGQEGLSPEYLSDCRHWNWVEGGKLTAADFLNF